MQDTNKQAIQLAYVRLSHLRGYYLTVEIEAKVAFLSQSNNYPGHPIRVDVVETHRSWVFMTPHQVYKLKKPVRYEFLDFSTVEARHRNCLEEVRLNRRLAGDVYLGIVPLTVDTAGNMHLGGKGIIVDWLVHMRRLPAARMLDNALRKQTVREADIRRFSRILANFYCHAEPVNMTLSEYQQRFEREIKANHQALSSPDFRLPKDQVLEITQAQLYFLEHNTGLFAQRIDRRKIIEAHGDLRPEHVCITPTPIFIDCLEFKRELRLLDPVDELSLLALECEHTGDPFVGEIVFDTYRQVTADAPPLALLHFYKSYRAALRAKLTIWHLKEPQPPPQRRKWINRAIEYLQLASQHQRML